MVDSNEFAGIHKYCGARIMLLKEMESIKYIRNSGGMFGRLLGEWKTQVSRGRPVDTLGRSGPYQILAIDLSFARSQLIGLQDTHDNQFVLFAEFGKNSFPNKNLLEEDRLAARLDMHGSNLPITLYTWLLRKGYSIMSSYSHSAGGRSVWERLAKTSGIDVIGYDLYNEQPFQVDTDNLQNEYLWTNDIEDELKLFRQDMTGRKDVPVMKKRLASLETALGNTGRLRLVASAGGK